MCYCGKPSVNGTPNAYSWDGKTFSTYPAIPPTLADDDELLHDLPGRCGGTDSHSYHLCLIKARFGGFALLVRHGGGEERLTLGYRDELVAPLAPMDETARYWFLMRLYHVITDNMARAANTTAATWRNAAAEKRIKVRKVRGHDAMRVEIVSATRK